MPYWNYDSATRYLEVSQRCQYNDGIFCARNIANKKYETRRKMVYIFLLNQMLIKQREEGNVHRLKEFMPRMFYSYNLNYKNTRLKYFPRLLLEETSRPRGCVNGYEHFSFYILINRTDSALPESLL